MPARIRYLLVFAIACTWAASLFLPVFYPHQMGWGVLVFGWLGALSLMEPDWLGNPLLMATVMLLLGGRRWPWAYLACAVPLALILASEAMRTTIIENEGGVPMAVTARFAGYYVWLAAVALGMFAAAIEGALAWHAGRARPREV